MFLSLTKPMSKNQLPRYAEMDTTLPNASKTDRHHTCAKMSTKCWVYRNSDGRKRNPAIFNEDEPKQPAACRCRRQRIGWKTRAREGTSPPSSEGGRPGAGASTCHTASPGPGHRFLWPHTEPPNTTHVQPLLALQD